MNRPAVVARPDLQRLEAFLAAYPAFRDTRHVDELRAADYGQLDGEGHVYLDYTGGGLYAATQVRQHAELLLSHVYGNPHSTNPTSLAATELVEAARDCVHDFFHAPADEYTVIFTSNATGALKLVGESYPFGPGSHYALTFDNHNSVHGIREYARAKGATVTYVPIRLPDMRADEARLAEVLEQAKTGAPCLFAFPAQSNFSGVQHPLSYIRHAKERGWDVILDAAAFAPTNHLDVAAWGPDFVPLSFYKMFGYPTGIGALIARRGALARLRRPWFAGGTITVASVQGDRHYLAEPPAGFEDGTLDFLGIPAVEIGLRHLAAIGQDTVHDRVRCLTGWLLDQLTALRHATGVPLVRVYGPVDTQDRGGAITLNFYDALDHVIDHRQIEAAANQRNISLRTGCFCNPGAGEVALGFTQAELASCFAQDGHQARLTMNDLQLCLDGKSTGAVRISVGLVTSFADVEALLAFARSLVDGGLPSP